MSELIQIHTTTASEAEALAIARALVERRLVACAQVSAPVKSVYHWQGVIDEGTEWRCSLKTTAEKFEQAAAAITQLHSYECPQIIAVPLVNVSEAYRAWLEQELGR